MPNWVGQQLGNYHLIRQLGKGSFGQVYLGEHVYLKTRAAIKLLLEDNGGETQAEAFQAAFLQEARRIAALKHSHILRVLDFGMEASTPYMVMEYAAHGTLLERHPRGTRVTVDQVVGYTTPLAQALHYAHEARLIHRDVKPANALLDERDTVLLSDFGIATIAHHTSSMRTSAYAGTAAYMAPEQLQGKPVPASDQYALAIMVYEWLCGQLPYQGDPIAVGIQHLMAPLPSLRLHNQALSPSIEAVVHQAMAKDPQQRFGTVLDFAAALERAAQLSIAPTLYAFPPSQGQRAPSQLPPTILATPIRPVFPVLTTPAAGSLSPVRHAIPPAQPKRKHSLLLVVVPILLTLMLVGGVYSAATGPWSWNMGRLWTAQNSNTSQDLSSVAWSGSQFVAVGKEGAILTSPDGHTWTTQNSNSAQDLSSVVGSGSQFVAVGAHSTILTSPDGHTWTQTSAPLVIYQDLSSVIWSGSQFVAVGTHTIQTSSNGSIWTIHYVDTPQSINSVAWSGSLFVAVGDGSNFNSYVTISSAPILTSQDGSNWTTQTFDTRQALYSVVWSGSQFVAVGDYQIILTSQDGSNWTTQTIDYNQQALEGIAGSGSRLVAVGKGGAILTSP